MSELKPCPFCGGDNKHSDDCYIPMLIEYVKRPLFLESDYEKKLEEAWNTRAERTCKMIPFVEEDDSIFIVNCSECGDAIFARGGKHNCNYCPTCGAKVVE